MPENASGNLPFGDVDRLADQVMDRAYADQAQLLGPDGLLTQRGRPVVAHTDDAAPCGPPRPRV